MLSFTLRSVVREAEPTLSAIKLQDSQLTEAAVIGLDPERMRVEVHGVEPFFWPIPFDNLRTVRDNVAEGLASFCRGRGVYLDGEAEPLAVIFQHLVIECLELYMGVALVRRLKEDALSLDLGSNSRLYGPIFEGRLPGMSPLVRRAMDGVPRQSAWRRAARAVVAPIRGGSLQFRRKKSFRPDEHVLVFSLNAMVLAHAEIESRLVVVGELGEWFRPGPMDELVQQSEVEQGVADIVVEVFRNTFDSVDEVLPDFLLPYISRTAADLVALARSRIAELEIAADKVPAEFWGGSAGNFHNRIMAHVVRKNGGLTVGHDHGTGSGWTIRPDQALNELNFFTNFVTFSESMARGLRANIRPEFVLAPEHENVITVLPRISERTRSTMFQQQLSGSKNVIYVAPLCAGERAHLSPVYPDIVVMDWQARLFGALRELGITTRFRNHPLNADGIPKVFTELYGCEPALGPYRDAIADADLLLFDQPDSTSFIEALESDRPIIFFDLPRIPLRSEARELLGRRCRIVEGWCADDGRVQIDWNELHDAVEDAARLSDRSYLTEFYGRP